MASVAASVAVGVGLVIARSERERRRVRQRKRDVKLGLRPGEALADGLRRMALAQSELALELLGGDGSASAPPDETAVHETRKALKRLRALLRLLRGELGERGFRRENAALRDIARQLSATRDATVMLATLDALIERHPRKLGRRKGVLALRRRVAAESARMQGRTLATPAERAEVLGELHAFRWRVAAWSLAREPGLRAVDAELERLYRQGRRRHRRLARGHGERTLAMHEWRKRVKDLRYAAEMLNLRKLAARADELGELIGEEHDLAVLAEHLREGARGHKGELWNTGRRTRKTLLRVIAKRRRKLRRTALRKGERLYRDKPSRFMRGLRESTTEKIDRVISGQPQDHAFTDAAAAALGINRRTRG